MGGWITERVIREGCRDLLTFSAVWSVSQVSFSVERFA